MMEPYKVLLFRTFSVSPRNSGLKFIFCEHCRHQVGKLKRNCACDGLCHPVIEPWDAERERRLATRRPKQKKATKRKPPKQYNDLTRI